ncbi:MAG TPA: S-layer homology domain-containing protein, partial [Anaerovoracaceae bacterium]|nr:S-layer homology domain-containing protein [Anaerovoracaceae bacterium]
MKKRISAVLILAIILSMFTGFAYAEEPKDIADVLELIKLDKIFSGKKLVSDVLGGYLTSEKTDELENEIPGYGQLRGGLISDGLTRTEITGLIALADNLGLNSDFGQIKSDIIAILGEEMTGRIIQTRGPDRSNSDFAYDLMGRMITKTGVIRYDTYTEKFRVNLAGYKSDGTLKGYLSGIFPNAFPGNDAGNRIDTAQKALTYILNEDADFDTYKADLRKLLHGYGFYSEYSTAPDPGDDKPKAPPETEEPTEEPAEAQVELGGDAVEMETGEEGQTIIKIKEDQMAEAIDGLSEIAKEDPDLEPQLTIKLDDIKTLDMEISIPADLMGKLAENGIGLKIESGALAYEVPADALAAILADAPEGSYIEFISSEVDSAGIEELIGDESANVAKVIELQLALKDSNGELIEGIGKFGSKIQIAIEIGAEDGNPDLLAVFYIDEETGELKFVGGKVKDGKINMATDHYSKFAVIEYDKSFSDIEGHWSEDYVKSMVAKHVIDGFEDNTYRPEGKLTRAQFAKLLVEVLELDKVAYKGEFKDVSDVHWAKDYIATAKQQGIIAGYEDGTFRPEQSINRAEMAAMITNALKLDKDSDSKILEMFKDAQDIPAWAVEYVVPVVAEGLLVGSDGALNPLGYVTRAEAATIIYRVYN